MAQTGHSRSSCTEFDEPTPDLLTGIDQVLPRVSFLISPLLLTKLVVSTNSDSGISSVIFELEDIVYSISLISLFGPFK
jgi:hypothetical protein